jgi:hypothetical protein
MKNDRGKYVFRVRKHDVEEFSEIVERHGIWKHDLQVFADALLKGRLEPYVSVIGTKRISNRSLLEKSVVLGSVGITPISFPSCTSSCCVAYSK